MFIGSLNSDSLTRIKNIENSFKMNPMFSAYDIKSYLYNPKVGNYAVEVSKNGQNVNLFLFYPDANGKIESIAIYGANLRGHLNAIKSSMTIFGMDVDSAEMDSGIADFVDVFLTPYDVFRDDGIDPFTFVSEEHQRYENGIPVQGLQICTRIIQVEKNVNGCKGYLLEDNDGYIVKMQNGDTGQAQMTDKPMRVVKSTSTQVTLRGYMVKAMAFFGYQDFDLSNYGLTVDLKNGRVSKCTLHMYDRHVDIEYNE